MSQFASSTPARRLRSTMLPNRSPDCGSNVTAEAGTAGAYSSPRNRQIQITKPNHQIAECPNATSLCPPWWQVILSDWKRTANETDCKECDCRRCRRSGNDDVE